MASQVTVIGPAARRHVVKTTPGTYLSDVLEQACTKMHLEASQYGLKHNSKTVDLSRTMRLSGLSAGAKLELTLLSRSPSVVSVALQLPSGTRLLDKFPSTTTLWFILRKFESGVAGSGAKDNLTARGIPKTGGHGGAGRLYHEQPILHIMGRDYSSFSDLQKSLSQIGFNNGSVLLRLSFQISDMPLEEAMEQIEVYFKSAGSDATNEGENRDLAPSGSQDADVASSVAMDLPNAPVSVSHSNAHQPDVTPESTSSPVANMDGTTTDDLDTTTIANRPTSIYRPPTSGTPQAASAPHNPADYVPTVEHARVHQAGLVKASQNTRLPTDAELEAQAAEKASRKAAINSVTIKLRFPDESSAVAPFGPTDTTSDLYHYVESLLRHGTSEPFEVSFAGPKGKMVSLPRNSQKLISQIGMEGKVLVQVRWADGASPEARKGASLRQEVAGLGKAIETPVIPDIADDASETASKKVGLMAGELFRGKGKEKGKGGMPAWFKMGKK